ncbi:MAG: glycosyltransferase family 39 protein, partial [Acetatifactor sp.]|nr:glycosyltransferase family 39 protein [Acetatifactor sp.]
MKDNKFPKISLTNLLPVILLLSGAFLRLVCLGSVPGGMHQDESFVAWNAFSILHEGIDSAGHIFPVYMADWGDGHSALYVWLLIPVLAWNGGHFSPFLSRLPQAVVSIFTLWSVYHLIKCLFNNKKFALWSLFLLAICPWHIMMSRWGLDANLAPGFLIFGLTFFIRGLDQKKYLLLSGLFYELSLYCYGV